MPPINMLPVHPFVQDNGASSFSQAGDAISDYFKRKRAMDAYKELSDVLNPDQSVTPEVSENTAPLSLPKTQPITSPSITPSPESSIEQSPPGTAGALAGLLQKAGYKGQESTQTSTVNPESLVKPTEPSFVNPPAQPLQPEKMSPSPQPFDQLKQMLAVKKFALQSGGTPQDEAYMSANIPRPLSPLAKIFIQAQDPKANLDNVRVTPEQEKEVMAAYSNLAGRQLMLNMPKSVAPGGVLIQGGKPIYENQNLPASAAFNPTVIAGQGANPGTNFKNLTPEQKLAALKTSTDITKTQPNVAGRIAGVRERANVTPVPVLNTEEGNAPGFASQSEVLGGGGKYMPAGEGGKALTKTALIEDMRGSVKDVKQSLDNLKTEFSPETRIALANAMKSADPHGAINTLINSQFVKNLTPDQQDYLINVNSLIENAMALRSALGAGQGSGDLRDAIRATVPSGTTPTKEYGIKQLERFNKTLDRLERGVPKVPLRTDLGSENKGTQLDANTAAAILKEAGGDKDKARAIAKQRGHTF